MTKAVRERIPPSPRLSARRMKTKYLIEMISTKAQKISDKMPKIFSRAASIACGPVKHSRTA